MASNTHGSKWLRREKRLAIYLRDDFSCLYCGQKLFLQLDMLTLDHLKPRIKDGHNGEHNLVTACKVCNNSRGDKSWRKFANDNDVISKINRHRRRSIKKRKEVARCIITQYPSWQESLLAAIYDED